MIRDQRPKPGYGWFYYHVHDNFAGVVGFQAWGVYTSLCRYVNSVNGGCKVSLDRLAMMWGVHVATIKRATSKLATYGLIEKRKKQGVSEYILLDVRPSPGFSTIPQGGRKNAPSGERKSAPSDSANLHHQTAQICAIEQESLNKNSLNKSAHPSDRENWGEEEGISLQSTAQKPPSQKPGMSAAERASWDYRRVRKEIDLMNGASVGSSCTGRDALEFLKEACHRAGVTYERWKEISSF